jgi:hypothetical protein
MADAAGALPICSSAGRQASYTVQLNIILLVSRHPIMTQGIALARRGDDPGRSKRPIGFSRGGLWRYHPLPVRKPGSRFR